MEGDTGRVLSGPSANQRYKDLWETRVAWSTVGAVVVHAGLIAFAGFQVAILPMVSPPSEGQLILLPASFGEEAGVQGRSSPLAVPALVEAEAFPAVNGGEDGSEAGGSGDEEEVLARWSEAVQRMGRQGRFRADVVELQPAFRAEPELPSEPDSEGVDGVQADASVAEMEGDSLDIELSFERLTELRPELAVMIPSMWILLRNPTEVESFLRRSYGRWTLDRGQPGTVTVTVWIDTRGSVEWAEVSESSGRQELDEAALALFNEVATFRPARHDGVSISGSATFALLFPW